MRLIGLKWKRREACSLWVLIGRGLDHMLCGLQKRKHSLCSILRLHLRKLTGADGDEATPVPIPNTEVKLISVENTWLATAWEDRAVPVQMKKSLPNCRKGFFRIGNRENRENPLTAGVRACYTIDTVHGHNDEI